MRSIPNPTAMSLFLNEEGLEMKSLRMQKFLPRGKKGSPLSATEIKKNPLK